MRLLLAAALAAALPAAALAAPTLSVGTSDEHGPHVVGPEGRPVYAFVTRARGGDGVVPLESCQQRCLKDWPLVTHEGQITVGRGLEPDLVGRLVFEDQPVLTYDGRALFHFFRDAPGEEPVGQAIHTYGGWWLLIRPDGSLVDTGTPPEMEGGEAPAFQD